MSIFDHEKKRSLYAIFGLSALMVFLLGALVGIAVAELRDPKPNVELTDYDNQPDVPSKGGNTIQANPADRVAEEPNTGVSDIGERSVLPSSRVWVRHVFETCGDALTEAFEGDLTGLSESELLEVCSRVEGMETSDITLERSVAGCCPSHYLLKWDRDALCVFSADATTYQPIMLTTVEIAQEILSAATQQALADGVLFASLSEIDQYIESMES